MRERKRDLESQTKRRGHVTVLDVAHAAGVSRATVSLVLRNSPSIPQKTRDRVMNAAAELGYVYNRGAASLRAAHSHIVGVVINDLTNPYFAEIVAAIQDGLSEAGRVVVLSNTAESPERQADFANTMREYNVDGIIISAAAGTDAAFIAHLRSWGMPLVLVSRNIEGTDADYVGANNREGMRQATKHLIDIGHRRIAMIGLNNLTSTGYERHEGYLLALQQAGIPVDPSLMYAGPATRDLGMAAILSFLDAADPPTATVCFNDVVAFGVMLGLRMRNLVPGQDFSVVGFDDIAEAMLWRPALTSVAISRPAIGRAATKLLLRRLQNPAAKPETILVPTQFVVRDTTRSRRP